MTIVDDYVFALELAEQNGSLEVRATGTTEKCPACGERVDVLEDRVVILTSSGKGTQWRTRRAVTHRRACYEAAGERAQAWLDAHPDFDLWER